jgi:uncharacterized RDD family membrane protein YckC
VILHTVLTPEKVPLTYRVAGIGARFLAWLIDGAFILGLAFIGVLFSLPLEAGRPGLGQALMVLWSFVLMWGYFLFFEWLWIGQTPGKRVLGIRVIQSKGTAISFSQSAVRNILRAADSLPVFYVLGFVAAATNREHRRLGDLAADTLVVHIDRQPRLIQALQRGGGDADRARFLLLQKRLGQLDREQKQTLLDLCLRRDQLRVRERARLFRAVAQYLQGRLELAPDEFESDEKFVLQMASVLGERGLPAEDPARARPTSGGVHPRRPAR